MKRVYLFGFGFLALCLSLVLSLKPAHAAEPSSGLSIQVTPSPLVATVKPGETAQLELKIRNTGTTEDALVIEPRSFHIDKSGDIKLDENTPPDINDWITLSDPTMKLKAGEIKTEKISIEVPKDAGFSYSFVMMIRRAQQPSNPLAGRQLQGSVAVFTLLNVDKPGATRKIELFDVTTSQQVYEFLPVKIKMRFKNTGNTITQPYGNIFIQRKAEDVGPIDTLPVNPNRGYLLPNAERELVAEWKNGFAVYETKTDSNGKQTQELVRDPNKLGDFRFGKYMAKVVAVYNDGQRDVPIEKIVTFWVIPWRAIGVTLLALIGALFLVRFIVKRKTDKAVRKALAAREKDQ